MTAGFPYRIKREEKEMNVVIKEKHLDVEWIRLIKEAKHLGLTTEEIRHFLKEYPEKSICS